MVLNETLDFIQKEVVKKELFLSCECGSEILKVEKYQGEDEYYLTVYSYLSTKYTFFERLCILFGGKVRTSDIVLSKKEFEKLKKWK